jgi:four helix bundle protein
VESTKTETSFTESRNYRDLIVWQKGMDLVVEIYQLTKDFPKEELYALRSQLQRAAVSIPSNIAEGQARGALPSEFTRFLRIALGSLAELDTQLELAIRLSYLTTDEIIKAKNLSLELRKMLFGLINSLK